MKVSESYFPSATPFIGPVTVIPLFLMAIYDHVFTTSLWFQGCYLNFSFEESKQPKVKGGNTGCFGYHVEIKRLCPVLITELGCRYLALMGWSIPNFNPFNIAACIHFLDNHDCPNGVMPILALILMILSDFNLSFNEAHKMVCAFARHTSRGKGVGGSDIANFMWFWRGGWNDKDNKTATSIIGGKSQTDFHNFSTPYLTPHLTPPEHSGN